jgi:sulfoxide reductase heme-binding subunit YedZ
MIARRLIQSVVPLTYLLAAWVLVDQGTGETGTRHALQGTARLALVLFVLAFVARPLNELWSTRVSAWLLANRRTIGICFGFSLSMHLWLILWLFYLGRPHIPESVAMADITIGIPGLIIVLLMLVTSVLWVRDNMKATTWQRLHTAGQYFVWFIFTADLIENYTESVTPLPAIHYVPFIVALMAVMAIRLGAVYLKR